VHPLPAHVRRLTDSTYLAVGLGVFILAAAVQLGLYLGILRPALSSGDLDRSRPAFVRWIITDLAWQGVVLVAAGGYVIATSSTHPGGVAWIAPPIAAVAGTALPLQLVAASALRAVRR
jgi:hypothetical protein